MSQTTAERIEALIRARLEPKEPQESILAYLKDHANGKRLDERLMAKLREVTGDESLRLSRDYGMANITWGGYYASGGRQGGSLLVAYREKNLSVDAAFIAEHNPAYFEAADDRNRDRAHVLENPELITGLASAIDRLLAAKADVERLTKYGADFYADGCAIRTEFGI